MYNKLFTKILDSSIWLEPVATRIVWITLIAAMDEDGYAHFSAIENLAARARVSVEEARAAVECFLAPDPNSSNPDNEGRRVERVHGGFMILNAKVHREIITRVIDREKTRIRVANLRARRRAESSGNAPVTPSAGKVTVPYAYASEVASEFSGEGDARGRGLKIPPKLEDVKRVAVEIGLTVEDAEEFFDHYESNGWKVAGKSRMKSVESSLRNWKRRKPLYANQSNRGSGGNRPRLTPAEERNSHIIGAAETLEQIRERSKANETAEPPF